MNVARSKYISKAWKDSKNTIMFVNLKIKTILRLWLQSSNFLLYRIAISHWENVTTVWLGIKEFRYFLDNFNIGKYNKKSKRKSRPSAKLLYAWKPRQNQHKYQKLLTSLPRTHSALNTHAGVPVMEIDFGFIAKIHIYLDTDDIREKRDIWKIHDKRGIQRIFQIANSK